MSWSIPNLLSLTRMGLIPLFVIAVLQSEPSRALLIFIVAGVTDALDGFIARFFHQTSLLGAYLDPIADKLLLTTAFVMLTIPNLYPGQLIPIWVTVLVLARDVLILVVGLVMHLAVDRTKFRPTVVSKVNTAAQITAVTLVLATGVLEGLETPAIVTIYLVAGLTVASGLDYIYRGVRMMDVEDAET